MLTLDSSDDRPLPRVVNLAARGGMRDSHWRNVRRRLDPKETTPFVADPEESVVEECARWVREHQVASERIAGFALVALFVAIAVCGWYGITWDSVIDWLARVTR